MTTGKIFWQLLKTELLFVRKNFFDNFINMFIWATCTLLINVHVLKRLGLQQNYDDLFIGGLIVAGIGFQIFAHIFKHVADFSGEKHIDYYLTLPISNYLVLIKSVCAYMVDGFIFGILALFICKMMLLDNMILSNISILHFLIALILTSAFFGCFTLFLVSICQNPGSIGNIFPRIIFPLWFVGGFAFPWETLYHTVPILGLLNLLNPYTYMTEMLRVATVGQQNFLPFWPSVLMLVLITFMTGYLGIKKIKKRLDFI